MRTARPAARPPHPFFELRAHPFDMLPPCLIFLRGDGPADPLVARERCYVFPSRQCLRVGRERFSEIGRKAMYDSFGDSNGCHRVISRARACYYLSRGRPESRCQTPGDQASDMRVQLGFWDHRRQPGQTLPFLSMTTSGRRKTEFLRFAGDPPRVAR
jgi:hypothetical protein